jgi:hypothetical protein
MHDSDAQNGGSNCAMVSLRRKGRRRKILLDHLIEEAEGRPIPEQELERVKARIVKDAAANLIFARKRKNACAYNFFQREPIRTSVTRTEHSQGGAQRSEQYLYGAQRAIK